MSSEWFQLTIDDTVTNRWFLRAPVRDVDVVPLQFRELTHGKSVLLSEFSGYEIPVGREGAILDFTIGAFNISVVSQACVDVLARIARSDLQFLPVQILPPQNGKEFYILVIRRQVKCFDWENSQYDLSPNSENKLRMVSEWRICKATVPTGVHFFYVAEWPAAMIVSRLLKEEFEQAGVTGVRYLPRG